MDIFKASGIRDWSKALRIHQWLKNLLVFVPLAASHRYTTLSLAQAALLGAVVFSLCASSVYLLNDLVDAADDRLHPTKRLRPIAAARISRPAAGMAAALLLLSAFVLALCFLPARFVGVLVIYYVLTLAYSLALKRRMVFDIMSLATLYTLRIIAGAAAIGVPLSFWLLAMAMFMFLSLSLVKRYAELFQLRASGGDEKARGRGYYSSDLEMIASLGAASGYMSVMVLALYINDANTATLYRRPEAIWLACPLLLTWISRMWMMTHRGFMDDDPLVFAVRDRISLILGALVVVVFWLAI